MNRKQAERANKKHDRGLKKQLTKLPMEDWGDVLDYANYCFARNMLEGVPQ